MESFKFIYSTKYVSASKILWIVDISHWHRDCDCSLLLALQTNILRALQYSLVCVYFHNLCPLDNYPQRSNLCTWDSYLLRSYSIQYWLNHPMIVAAKSDCKMLEAMSSTNLNSMSQTNHILMDHSLPMLNRIQDITRIQICLEILFHMPGHLQ